MGRDLLLPELVYWRRDQQADQQRLPPPTGRRIRLDGADELQVRRGQGKTIAICLSDDGVLLFAVDGRRRHHQQRPLPAVPRTIRKHGVTHLERADRKDIPMDTGVDVLRRSMRRLVMDFFLDPVLPPRSI